MPTPGNSPASSSPLPPDGQSLHSNQVASSSRPRRRVAMFSDPAPGTTSSSDEEDIPPRASSANDNDTLQQGQYRSSFPGVSQYKTSPTSRISDIVQSSLNRNPTLPRSLTTPGNISTVSSTQSHNSTQNQNHSESSMSTLPNRNPGGGPSGTSDSRLRQSNNRTAGPQGNFQPTGQDALDPEGNFYQRLAHLDDSGSEAGSDEADMRLDELPVPLGSVSLEDSQGNPYESYRHAISPSAHALEPDSKEGLERLEWQNMLASVLAGDVLRGESTRQGLNEPTKGGRQKALGQSYWWQIRARMRGRTEEEEKRRVEDRRGRIVDGVLEEMDSFVIKKHTLGVGVERRLSSEDDVPTRDAVDPEDKEAVEHEEELSALDQVNYMLEKLSLVEALYPHYAALRHAKPLYDSEKFQARVNGLTAWSTIVHQLQNQLQILQKWTGSDELDITRPNTTKEKALVSKNRYHPLDAKAKAQSSLDLAADDSTFLERVMKEDNLQRTFEKRIFVDIMSTVLNAKETVTLYLPLFTELGLPDFQYELVRLIGFPGRLIIEALKVRLDAAAKLVDPNPMVINDMIDNFRLSISLAVLIKRQYEDVISPDSEKRWQIPPCMAPDYDAVLLEGLRTFFKLLHWKLKSGNRAMYFKETEVLEDEWEFLYEAAEAVEGGDLVVAESFCSLTNKLMVRVSNFFETQLNVPVRLDPSARPRRRRDLSLQPDMESRQRDKRQMTAEEMLSWYGKILEAVKMRYRKLQRFAWRLTSRHDNSAEYLFTDDDLEPMIERLQETSHFLVYTETFEREGTYIMAEGSLWDNPAAVKQMLKRTFASSLPLATPRQAPPESDHVNDQDNPESPGETPSSEEIEAVDEEDDAGYLLLISPCQNFAWTGAVMVLDVDYFDFELRDNRVRLIADGPTSRLDLCKSRFDRDLGKTEKGEPAIPIEILIEAQAHLPRVQRELKKIARSTQRLNESIIQSAAQVRRSLEGSAGTQEMVQNWFAFASDHGRRVQSYVSAASWPRFSRLCMRLAISWVAFICDSCDPTDRRTFRWTVNALRTAYEVTGGKNILHLDPHEFALLRKSVAALVSFLILHFDILGAKSSMEAKREAERVEAMRRLQRMQEDYQDDFLPRNAAAMARGSGMGIAERSIRLVREERLRLISELDQQRVGVSNDQHLIGQVLDEQVSEDRALVFLAASSSNIALRWQQGAFIGGGANGNVYIGFNLDSGGIMAVKEIRVQDLSNSPTLYKQIKDESDVMSMLSHPNIVEYYGIEVHRDRVYIFEEYCEGGSLANLLEHGRVEDEEVIMVYALQMLQGLEYLHARGIEHRDVKPDNILLGTNSTIKFVDFGAAKVIAKGNKTMARTRVANRTKAPGADGAAVMNSLAGTPMYMAPEVIKNEKTGRLGSSDIWSMGCCLLEIVTGRKPWSNLDNEWAIMFHIGIATQHPPLPDPSQMSDIGIDFIEQCVTLDPTERPSAVELIQHPWLTPMVEAMATHAHGNEGSYSGSGGSYNSGSTTLVDSLDSITGHSRSYSSDSKLDSTEEVAENAEGQKGNYGYEGEENGQ